MSQVVAVREPDLGSSYLDNAGQASSYREGLLDISTIQTVTIRDRLHRMDIEAVARTWQREDHLLAGTFSESEIAKLRLSLPNATSPLTVVFASYENPWGKSGGVEAVTKMLPHALRQSSEQIPSLKNQPISIDLIFRLSPLHSGLISSLPESLLEEAKLKGGTHFNVPPQERAFLPPEACNLAPLWSHQVDFVRQGSILERRVASSILYIGKCDVPFGIPEASGYRRNYKTDLFRLESGGSEPQSWILFNSKEFFNADGGRNRDDPYIFSSEVGNQCRDRCSSLLLRNSLFACRAIPEILRLLDLRKNVIVHAQDWQFAATSLTIKDSLLKGEVSSAATVLTLHNPYDHGVDSESLKAISERFAPELYPPLASQKRTTVLSNFIPLFDAPISTVSRNFAWELTNHPLQTGHFTAHYKEILSKKGIVGIDNGLFEMPRYTSSIRDAVSKGLNGDPTLILAEKQRLRNLMLEEVAQFILDSKDEGTRFTPQVFGDLTSNNGDISKLDPDTPVFFLSGRLDPGQKGYDLAARLIESLPRGYGKFILSPLSPLRDDPSIAPFFNDLIELAEERRGDLLVVGSRLNWTRPGKEGFFSTVQSGVTWSLWPSLYEPFGGVSELYLKLTPVIAHATGGLEQQVIDYSYGVEHATGFLYSESATRVSSLRDEEMFHQVLTAPHPKNRRGYDVYENQIRSLTETAIKASNLFKSNKEEYGRILANLPRIAEFLRWERSVVDYHRWYELALSR